MCCKKKRKKGKILRDFQIIGTSTLHEEYIHKDNSNVLPEQKLSTAGMRVMIIYLNIKDNRRKNPVFPMIHIFELVLKKKKI